MKAAVSRLLRVSNNADNQRRLAELGFAYADIADVPVSGLRWDDVHLDRTNARWKELITLARLLLGDRFQTSSMGRQDGFSLLFEMNTLFEEYGGTVRIPFNLVRELVPRGPRRSTTVNAADIAWRFVVSGNAPGTDNRSRPCVVGRKREVNLPELVEHFS